MLLFTSDINFPSRTSLLQLPEEIIQKILSYCGPDDINLNVQRVCQKLKRLSNEPLLWRERCYKEFRYWNPNHQIQLKFTQPIEHVDWKSLYRYRRRVDLKTTQLLNGILQSQVSRTPKYEEISKFGYDSKDTLLRHIRVDENAPDVLARRYYATSVLDHLHRMLALEEWEKVLKNGAVPIERAMGCFDMFVLQDRPNDIYEISRIFDMMAENLRQEYPGVENLSPRAKALATTDFMNKHNITDFGSSWTSQKMESNFIGLYLHDPNSPPVTHISVVIYCALSRRIGLNACGFATLNYIYIIIIPRPGETLDSKKLREGELGGEPMYLDPQRFMEEVPLSMFKKAVRSRGLDPDNSPELLVETSTASMILWMSNIIFTTSRRLIAQNENRYINSQPVIRHPANIIVDSEKADYSSLWAKFFISGYPAQMNLRRPRSLLVPAILEKYERFFPMDSKLIEKYILPIFDSPQNSGYSHIASGLNAMRDADQIPKQMRLRNNSLDRIVKYQVGQVFRHKRYGYCAVICGWNVEGETDYDYAISTDVNPLLSENYQSYYHALVEDKSIRYVAQENIEIIKPELPNTLIHLAGRYFRRWDKKSRTFISGIRDEYPQD